MLRLLVVLAAVGVSAIVGGARASNAGFPGRNGLIAFAGGHGRLVQIFTVDASGNGLRRLTSRLNNSEPSFSRDGSLIVYAHGGVRADVWTMHADGSHKRRLTFTPRVDEQNPSWSADGTQIAVERGGIWVMNSDGGDRWRLTPRAAVSAPRWSPDGSRIVFGAADGRIYVIPAAGGPAERLLKGSDPDWSPDGRSIVFSREQDSRRGTSIDLWVVDADGTGLRPLTNTPTLFESGPAWSPDGAKILFAATKGGCGAARLFVMNANGSSRRWLGRTTAAAPSWQPALNVAVVDRGGAAAVTSRGLARAGHCGF